ncbi:MAG: alpha/beta fold hydrolase [Spirochaeta sp.]|jgi:carboxylesterase|nr:alpha/beta fold hydrolase [Spirochaeta sp.]
MIFGPLSAGISPDTTVVSAARSFRLNGSPINPAVLLLHGFTGQSSEMRFLGEQLHARGMTVYAPRLPGHGTNGGDFRNTSWRHWLRGAVDAYLDLRSESSEVMVAGLSMGGLLATIVAAHFPVSRVALLAPAFATTNSFVRFTPLLRFLVPSFSVSNPERYDDPDQQHLADHYWNIRRPAQIASLAQLMRLGRRALPRVTAPTLTIVSQKDGTVPARVAQLVERKIAAAESRTITLAESGHVITSGVEKELVAAGVTEWFTRSLPS